MWCHGLAPTLFSSPHTSFPLFFMLLYTSLLVFPQICCFLPITPFYFLWSLCHHLKLFYLTTYFLPSSGVPATWGWGPCLFYSLSIPSAYNSAIVGLRYSWYGFMTWSSNMCRKLHFWGFPGGAVVENLPANAGDTGSSPGLGRSHMPRSDWARGPQLLSLRVWSLCPARNGRGRNSERPAHHDEEWPQLATTRESPRTKQRPNTAKK